VSTYRSFDLTFYETSPNQASKPIIFSCNPLIFSANLLKLFYSVCSLLVYLSILQLFAREIYYIIFLGFEGN
jgi:hypothetical protein